MRKMIVPGLLVVAAAAFIASGPGLMPRPAPTGSRQQFFPGSPQPNIPKDFRKLQERNSDNQDMPRPLIDTLSLLRDI